MNYLIRFSGLTAIIAGLIFILIGVVNYPENIWNSEYISVLSVNSSTQFWYSSGLLLGAILSYVYFDLYIRRNFYTNIRLRAAYRTSVVAMLITAITAADPEKALQFAIHALCSIVLIAAFAVIAYEFADLKNQVHITISKTSVLVVTLFTALVFILGVFIKPLILIGQIIAVTYVWYWITFTTLMSPVN